MLFHKNLKKAEVSVTVFSDLLDMILYLISVIYFVQPSANLFIQSLGKASVTLLATNNVGYKFTTLWHEISTQVAVTENGTEDI